MGRIFKLEYKSTQVKNTRMFFIQKFTIDNICEMYGEYWASHGYINFKDNIKKLKRKYNYNKKCDSFYCYEIVGGVKKLLKSVSSIEDKTIDVASTNRFSIIRVPEWTIDRYCQILGNYSEKLGYKLSDKFFKELNTLAMLIEGDAHYSPEFDDIKFSIRHAQRFLDRILPRTLLRFEEFIIAFHAEYTNCLSCDNNNSEKLEQYKNSNMMKSYLKSIHKIYWNEILDKYLEKYFPIKEEQNMEEINFGTSGCMRELKSLIEDAETEKVLFSYYKNNYLNRRENNMNFTINEEKKVVTLVAQESVRVCADNAALKDRKIKEVSMVKCHKDDEFDRYIGAALAYVYNEFGSKTAFRKWVDSHSKIIKKEEKKKLPKPTIKPRPKKQQIDLGKEVK